MFIHHPIAGDLSVDQRIARGSNHDANAAITGMSLQQYASWVPSRVAASAAASKSTVDQVVKSGAGTSVISGMSNANASSSSSSANRPVLVRSDSAGALRPSTTTRMVYVGDEFSRSKGPVNLVYITTLKEIFDGESVGRNVVDAETNASLGRRVGNLEDLVQKLNTEGSTLYGRINLVGIVFDDDPEKVAQIKAEGGPWNWNATVPHVGASGTCIGNPTLEQISFCLPSSSWASIKVPRLDGEENAAYFKRAAGIKAGPKAEYERRMANFLELVDADLVLSDSYTRIFGPDMLKWAGTKDGATHGRIINVHPAIARVGNPARLPGVTPTRDCYTRERYGWVIIDDKNAVDLPPGPDITVEFAGKQRTARAVAPTGQTGVTVHVTAPKVDNGNVIQEKTAPLPNASELTQEKIRATNYELKKQAVTDALLAYPGVAQVKDLMAAGRDGRGIVVTGIQ